MIKVAFGIILLILSSCSILNTIPFRPNYASFKINNSGNTFLFGEYPGFDYYTGLYYNQYFMDFPFGHRVQFTNVLCVGISTNAQENITNNLSDIQFVYFDTNGDGYTPSPTNFVFYNTSLSFFLISAKFKGIISAYNGYKVMEIEGDIVSYRQF